MKEFPNMMFWCYNLINLIRELYSCFFLFTGRLRGQVPWISDQVVTINYVAHITDLLDNGKPKFRKNVAWIRIALQQAVIARLGCQS